MLQQSTARQRALESISNRARPLLRARKQSTQVGLPACSIRFQAPQLHPIRQAHHLISDDPSTITGHPPRFGEGWLPAAAAPPLPHTASPSEVSKCPGHVYAHNAQSINPLAPLISTPPTPPHACHRRPAPNCAEPRPLIRRALPPPLHHGTHRTQAGQEGAPQSIRSSRTDHANQQTINQVRALCRDLKQEVHGGVLHQQYGAWVRAWAGFEPPIRRRTS